MIHQCSICGFEWPHGHDGRHDCASSIVKMCRQSQESENRALPAPVRLPKLQHINYQFSVTPWEADQIIYALNELASRRLEQSIDRGIKHLADESVLLRETVRSLHRQSEAQLNKKP